MFIDSSVSGHLGCFHFLSILINAAINIGVQIPVQILAFKFFWDIAKVETGGSHSNFIVVFFLFCFVFLRNHHTFSFIVA